MDPASAVVDWFSKVALSDMTGVGFAQIDLDDLLRDPPRQAVMAALECLQVAVTEVRRTVPDVDGILSVPLPWSDSLTLDSPKIEEILEEPWAFGPGREVPGLCLVRGSIWRAYAGIEEYRRHLPTEGSLPSGCVAYYRTWRSEDDAARGWPYRRTIQVRTADNL